MAKKSKGFRKRFSSFFKRFSCCRNSSVEPVETSCIPRQSIDILTATATESHVNSDNENTDNQNTDNHAAQSDDRTDTADAPDGEASGDLEEDFGSAAAVSVPDVGSAPHTDGEQLAREPTPGELVKKIPLTHIIGMMNQFTCGGLYAGSQCTSIALTAAAYHQNFLPLEMWSRDIMDMVLLAGDHHHTMFRDVYHISRNSDSRVALDELPSRLKLTFGGAYDIPTNIGENSGLLFLSLTPFNREFKVKSLKEHIEKEMLDSGVSEAGFVITVQDFSHALVKDMSGYWYLYDSHGFLNIPPCAYESGGEAGDRMGATLTRFHTLDALVSVLLDNYSSELPCEARRVWPDGDCDWVSRLSRASSVEVKPQSPSPRSNVQRHFFTAPPIYDAHVDDVPPEDVIYCD